MRHSLLLPGRFFNTRKILHSSGMSDFFFEFPGRKEMRGIWTGRSEMSRSRRSRRHWEETRRESRGLPRRTWGDKRKPLKRKGNARRRRGSEKQNLTGDIKRFFTKNWPIHHCQGCINPAAEDRACQWDSRRTWGLRSNGSEGPDQVAWGAGLAKKIFLFYTRIISIDTSTLFLLGTALSIDSFCYSMLLFHRGWRGASWCLILWNTSITLSSAILIGKFCNY